jgi:hypothetical protein
MSSFGESTLSSAGEWRLVAAPATKRGYMSAELPVRPCASQTREIIFSVCAVEAYLFEWVRDEVLGGDFRKVNTYFPAGRRRSITERWQDVTRRLHHEQLLSTVPNWGTKPSQDFTLLVRYRNGLVHGGTSRPYTTGLPEGEEPFPSDQVLMKLPQGWTVDVVVAFVEHVHKEVGTIPPTWLHC